MGVLAEQDLHVSEAEQMVGDSRARAPLEQKTTRTFQSRRRSRPSGRLVVHNNLCVTLHSRAQSDARP